MSGRKSFSRLVVVLLAIKLGEKKIEHPSGQNLPETKKTSEGRVEKKRVICNHAGGGGSITINKNNWICHKRDSRFRVLFGLAIFLLGASYSFVHIERERQDDDLEYNMCN